MSKFEALRARVAVILKAAPTYLTAAATLLTVIVSLSPAGPVAAFATAAIAAIGSAIAIIRRVTPVVEGERGILPTDAA
jgi:hypothetical protein